MLSVNNDSVGLLGSGLVALVFLLSMAFKVSAEQSEHKPSEARPQLHVVSTFSILADLVAQVGQDRVDVYSLVDWDEDAHVFQPSPDDVKKIAKADLLVLNGLGFDAWLSRLKAAAQYSGSIVEVSRGVDLIRLKLQHSEHDDHHDGHHHASHAEHEDDKGVYDPHAWHSLTAAMVYVRNITKALIDIDPESEAYYQQNSQRFITRLQALDDSIKLKLAGLSTQQKQLVVPHNAFAYFARDYHVQIHSLQGISTDAEASAADLAKIVRIIRKLNVHAIFTENVSDKRLIRVVESETDATIKGALVSGALSRDLAPSYLEMMQYNSRLIIEALTQK
ncbi:MAG: metal ABC transporter solute-binding protein, Zn/Mn family [Oleiphilus sp.]